MIYSEARWNTENLFIAPVIHVVAGVLTTSSSWSGTGIPCGHQGCAVLPTTPRGVYAPGNNTGYTWSKTFPNNSHSVSALSTAPNNTGLVSGIPTVISVVQNIEEGDNEHVPTIISVVKNLEKCDCENVPEYDPVYASIRMFVGSGVGYNRSKTILCKATAENLGNITEDGCPIRELDYLVHINRITENYTINRSKNVKHKN